MKWIKKLFKCMLIFIAGIIGLVVVLVGITILNSTWHTEKFRFENFKTAEELIAYIEINFPKGSDSKPLIDLLENAGAQRRIIPKEYYSERAKAIGTDYWYGFSYNAGWLYHPMLMQYNIYLWVDKNEKIIDFSIGTESGGL